MASALSDSVGLSMDMRQGITVVSHHAHGYLISVPISQEVLPAAGILFQIQCGRGYVL